jgi:hypothetical protein
MPKKITLKSLKTKAWALMSEWIRRKDADYRGYTECYTCGVVKPWKEMDCGHFQHNKLDFDERNLKPQCTYCNNKLWGGGRLDKYALRLIDEYGRDWVDKLVKDSIEKGNYYNMTEMKLIIEDLKFKLKELEGN